jgi:hypothetical protein
VQIHSKPPQIATRKRILVGFQCSGGRFLFLRLTEPVIGSAEATIKSALKSRPRPRQRAWPAPRDAACVLNHAMAIMWT